MMSNIKVGDKVRFLNSTGGGVVRSFKGKDQVLVEDEDGFEVPALIRECVVVGDSEMQVHSSRRSPLPSVTQAAVLQPKKPEPQPEVEKVTETIEGERLNIYLAYLPIEPATPLGPRIRPTAIGVISEMAAIITSSLNADLVHISTHDA